MTGSARCLVLYVLLCCLLFRVVHLRVVSYGIQYRYDEGDEHIVKIRGLPWSTSVEDLAQFFSDCKIKNGTAGVHVILSKEGRPSGEAYIEMESGHDVELACTKDQEYLAHRYIEVFRAARYEMERAIRRSELSLERSVNDGCVRVRGLPFKCSQNDIAQFFDGLNIVPNGIFMKLDDSGRPNGEAYIQFGNKEMAENALKRHKQKLMFRYIEVFRSSLGEMRLERVKQRPVVLSQAPQVHAGNFRGYPADTGWQVQEQNQVPRDNQNTVRSFRQGWADRGGFRSWQGKSFGGQHCVRMRGIPFRATQIDIAMFFHPLTPVHIRLVSNGNGKPSGKANVEFATHEEALKAMEKDKSYMQHRYIELFLNSMP